MIISTGVDPNCSELVARLYPISNEHELHQLLHKLEKITDWTIGIQQRGEFIPKYNDITKEIKECLLGREGERMKISRSIRIEDVELGNYFHITDEPIFNPERLDEPLRTFFKENSWDNEKGNNRIFLLDEMDKNDIKITKPLDQIDGLEITQSDGYCSAPEVLLQAAQHCYTAHFEPMAKALDYYETKWHTEDGGYSGPFEQYCENNNFKEVKSRYG